MLDSDTRLVLIPAMGLSARFAAAGHSGPKALLPLDWQGLRTTMAEMIVRSIPRGWTPVFIVLGDHFDAFNRTLGDGVRILSVASPTMGQSDTVLWGLRGAGPRPDAEVAVQNCDVVFDRLAMIEFLGIPDSAIAWQWQPDRDPRYSYINQTGRATQFVEKQPISDRAISGLYRFRRARDLEVAIEQQLARHEVHGSEFYLSGALNHLPQGMVPYQVERSETLDLGTPEAVARAGITILQDTSIGQ